MKNTYNLNLMKKLCKAQKQNLQKALVRILKNKGYSRIIEDDMFILAEGELPVCLIAHTDTVFSRPPSAFFFDKEKTTLWSPQGLGSDDRAGIYAILRLLERGYKPSVLFTDFEEQGCVGAGCVVNYFAGCPFEDCKALIQLDRRGSKDAVYYDCSNNEFEDKINSYGFTTNWGTFTDISVIAPAWGVAAVNLSVGYQNEHSIAEYVNMRQLENTIEKVSKILDDINEWARYKYIHAAQLTFTNNWQFDSCVCCGKPLKKNEGYLDCNFRVCDKCHNEWFK